MHLRVGGEVDDEVDLGPLDAVHAAPEGRIVPGEVLQQRVEVGRPGVRPLVDAEYPVTLLEQLQGQVRADLARRAGDENAHRLTLPESADGGERLLAPTEGGRGRLLDQHVDELAGACLAGEVDRRVPARPPAQHRLVGPRRPLDEHLLDAADPLGVPLRREPLGQLDEPLQPLDLDLVGDLPGQLGRLGALARRVDERVGAVEADRRDELEGLREVGLGLTRKADDDVGAERDVRNGRAEPV